MGTPNTKKVCKICIQAKFFQSLIFACVFAVIWDIWHAGGYKMVYKTSGVLLILCQVMSLYSNVQRTVQERPTIQQKSAYLGIPT